MTTLSQTDFESIADRAKAIILELPDGLNYSRAVTYIQDEIDKIYETGIAPGWFNISKLEALKRHYKSKVPAYLFEQANLDGPVHAIQRLVGARSGDFASHFFSNIDEDDFKNFTHITRAETLIRYFKYQMEDCFIATLSDDQANKFKGFQ